MPRNRLTEDQALNAVFAVLPASGADVPAQTLREALESSGSAAVIDMLPLLKKNGAIEGKVRLNPDGTITHVYARKG